MDNAGVAQLV